MELTLHGNGLQKCVTALTHMLGLTNESFSLATFCSMLPQLSQAHMSITYYIYADLMDQSWIDQIQVIN